MLVALAVWIGLTVFFLTRNYCLSNKNVKIEVESLPKKEKEIKPQHDGLNKPSEKNAPDALLNKIEEDVKPQSNCLTNQKEKNETETLPKQEEEDLNPLNDKLK